MSAQENRNSNGAQSSPDSDSAPRQRQDEFHTSVNIGIVGARGSGKSTLIRAITDLFPPDSRAFSSPQSSRSMPTPYYHPFNEQIVFWDCPPLLGGAIRASESSDKLDLTPENYFDKISRLENEAPNENVKERLPHIYIPERVLYDCFLICVDGSFNQEEADLARIFSEHDINCYFIKTKFDTDILSIDQTATDKQSEIEKIRTSCKENLEKRLNKTVNNRLFFISGLVNREEKIDNRRFFDFARLQKTMINDMPEEKKTILIMSLLPLDKEDVVIKCETLRKRVNSASLYAGVSGLSPIPGTSIAVDFGIIIKELFIDAKTLNLSKNAIEQMANSYGISYESIERDILLRHQFVKSVVEIYDDKSIINDSFLSLVRSRIIGALATFLAASIIANTVQETLKFIPFIGSIVGAVTSFATTKISLNKIIGEFETTLNEIFDYCAANKQI